MYSSNGRHLSRDVCFSENQEYVPGSKKELQRRMDLNQEGRVERYTRLLSSIFPPSSIYKERDLLWAIGQHWLA